MKSAVLLTFGFLAPPYSSPGAIVAVTNGAVEWGLTDPFGGLFLAGLAVGNDGTVYTGDWIGGVEGIFMAVTNGAIEWTNFAGTFFAGSSPVIAQDGTVLVGNQDGYLYAYWGGMLPPTNAVWPMFQHDAQHTGTQPAPLPATGGCGAPFVYNGTNDGSNFTFQIVGETNFTWNVYSSEDLSNWMQIGTNIALNIASGSADLSGTNTFTDSTVTGVSRRFYQLSNSNCCSQAIGFVTLNIVPGTNLIANQLYQVDDNVLFNSGQTAPMNTLAALFLYYNPLGTDANGMEVFEWNGNGFDSDEFLSGFEIKWINGGYATLLPGHSAFIVNTNASSFPVPFIGLVRNEQIFDIISATNYLSATAPISGTITNVTGFVPHEGDTVQLWNNADNQFISHTYHDNSWSNGVPSLNVGQGFVLVTTNRGQWTNFVATGACGQ